MSSKQWPDGPLPMIATPALTRDKYTHAAIHIATEMALVHNCLLRGLNSIILQAPHLRDPTDIQDFLFFCLVWCRSTDNHHATEEEHIFPAVETLSQSPQTVSLMNRNREQHASFHDGLESFRKYAEETRVEDFDAGVLKGMLGLEGWVGVFASHLREEVGGLVELESLESEPLKRIWKEAEGKAGASVRKDEVFPLILGCNDRTFEGGMHSFPPVPYLVTLFIKYWFARTHAGAWRFCPSDIFGQPRPLMFLH